MRDAGRRFDALIGGVNQWVTEVDVLIDGQWVPVTYLDGGVQSSAGQECRWQTSGMVLDAVPAEVDPLGTRMRVRHGIADLPLLPMGVYKITDLDRDQTPGYRLGGAQVGTVTVSASSDELYAKRDDWATMRVLQPMSAFAAIRMLIKELFPNASVEISDQLDDIRLPRLEGQNRWQMLDGKDDAPSIAKALGAVVFCGPSGEWIVAPQPTLADPIRFEARSGEGGILLEAAEALSDEGVANRVIVAPDGDNTWPTQVVEDLDPYSPTYIKRPIEQGGFGPKTFTYTSAAITNSAQAKKVAQAQLAARLGLRQQLTYGQAHDPRTEVGDVALIHTQTGARKVILDDLIFDLGAATTSAQTRTTATRYAGESYELPDGGE